MAKLERSNFTDVTLAMDLALSQPGFAVLAVYEGQPIALETSYIKTNAKKTHGQRLQQIYRDIERLIKTYEPVHYVREKGFSRFAATTQALFKVVGASDIVVADFAEEDTIIYEIPPTTIKKEITGDGKADKEDVAAAVFVALQIENTDDFYRIKRNGERELIDDMTDACAVGLTYMRREGIVK